MMTPSGSSQHSSLQLCVTLSTVTTLQSHNLESVNRKAIFYVPYSKANEIYWEPCFYVSNRRQDRFFYVHVVIQATRYVEEFNTLSWWGVSSVSVTPKAIGSLSSDVFERRTSTGSGRFALLSRDFEQILGQIVSIRIKTLGNTNMVASRLIKRGKSSLPVDVRRSKTLLLKLPNTGWKPVLLIEPPMPTRWKGRDQTTRNPLVSPFGYMKVYG